MMDCDAINRLPVASTQVETMPPEDQRMEPNVVTMPTRRKFSEPEVFAQAFWCLYCCCCGTGLGPRSAQCGHDCGCTCCRQTYEGVPCSDADEGFCSGYNACLCCAFFFMLPAKAAQPRCVLCSNPFCINKERAHETPERRPRRSEELQGLYEIIMLRRYIPLYCCCCGCAENLGDGGLPCCGIISKSLCCRCICNV